MTTKITPVLPPKNKEGIEAAVKNLFEALKALSITVDPDGFVRAWLSDSTRIVLATEDGKPVGVAAMAFGRRYYDQRFTASVLFCTGPAWAQVLSHMKDMAVVLGAEMLIYEPAGDDPLGGKDAGVKFLEL